MHTDPPAATRTWLIAAAFFTSQQDRWIDDFVPAESGHRFRKIPSPVHDQSWHERKTRHAGMGEWASHWAQIRNLFAKLGPKDGIITAFPQLGLVAAVRKLLFWRRNPLIAYCFNIGAPPGRWQRLVGRVAFRACTLIVVHSTAEIQLVSRWFSLPPDRIRFLPLQSGAIDPPPPPVGEPYVVAMGSANRDYAVLVKAAAMTGLRTIIVASPRLVDQLDRPPNVEFRHGLSMEECRSLAVGARLSVVPLVDGEASSGQITLIEAMRLGCPVVATATIGTVDYVRDGQTGYLVRPGDAVALAEAMQRLWDEDDLRRDTAARAQAYAETELSDEAAGRRLLALLDEVSAPSRD
ncbi:glycosyltransferase [Novosphingobium flavum]|uniref:glycosyltransferase n=1 Tax=Novosphingobium aerophilum TaxID=2839843 RepID=UPI00163B17C2|nr:glycosyltransferase [Novosphingobium aerophilum]MBC2660947.1 glycosyltransferase [Novosphingobium aerophilum]